MPYDTTKTLSGFPDAASTGVRPGVALKVVGDLTVTTPGAVISGLEIHGRLTIEAPNVTVVDCKIINDEYHAILIPDPYSATVTHCDIIGGVNGISGTGTFTFNDFSQNENGINVYGPSMISDNYIHDLAGGPDAHFDGIEINGGGGTTIRHNTIINDHSQTSAIMIDNNFGGVDGLIVDNNYLAGGGYTVYADGRTPGSSISGVQFTNNVLGEGYWGYYAFMANSPLVSNNTELGHDWPTPVSDGSASSPVTPPVVDPVVPPTTGGTDGSGSGTGTGGTTGGSSGSGSGGTTGGTTGGSTGGTDSHSGHHHWHGSSDGGSQPAPAPAPTPTAPVPAPAATSFTGTNGINRLVGDSHDNVLDGKGADDFINGGAGNDTIIGGTGKDTMTGGAGNDHFVFNSVSEMGINSYRDIITDFTHGQDKIDLSAIDANTKVSGNQAFSFLPTDDALFTKHRGEVAWHTDVAHNQTIVQGDMNGDGRADFEIQLTGIVHLTASDFVF